MSELEQFGYKQDLKRTLTFKDLLVYGMIFMVPIAPMSVYGTVAKESHGMVPLVYLVGIIAMTFTALSYNKMSKRFPMSGSVFAYVQRGINPHVGFVAGWLILLDYIMIPALIYAFTGVWAHSVIPGVPSWGWALIFCAFNTVVNVLGIEYSSKTDMVLLVLELLCLVLFLFIGFAYVLGGGGTGHFTLTSLYQPGRVNFGFIATATSTAALSFLGFDAISTLAEETKDPEKNVGRATIVALVGVGFLFMLQTYLASLIFPDFTKLNPDTGFYDLAAVAGGTWLKNLLLGMNIMAVGIANSMAAQLAVSRILFSMSRDKLIPSFFSRIHSKFKTPYLSTIFVAVFSLAVAWAVKIQYLVKLVNFGALTSFMILNFTVFWFFFIKEKNRDTTDTFNYLILPFLGLGIIFYVWWGFDNITKIVGIVWLIIGIIYGAIKSKGYKEVPDVFRRMPV